VSDQATRALGAAPAAERWERCQLPRFRLAVAHREVGRGLGVTSVLGTATNQTALEDSPGHFLLTVTHPARGQAAEPRRVVMSGEDALGTANPHHDAPNPHHDAHSVPIDEPPRRSHHAEVPLRALPSAGQVAVTTRARVPGQSGTTTVHSKPAIPDAWTRAITERNGACAWSSPFSQRSLRPHPSSPTGTGSVCRMTCTSTPCITPVSKLTAPGDTPTCAAL
jgi:hypothetical protein